MAIVTCLGGAPFIIGIQSFIDPRMKYRIVFGQQCPGLCPVVLWLIEFVGSRVRVGSIYGQMLVN